MSSRTRAADKAVRLAWEREQECVREGKGTRDWTAEQQRDILDPDIGKARDENNRAFEGQHMRSVEKNPEYQGNPDNIQFLTRAEHFEAHKRNWQNPTNWYYDPVTKEYVDFGDGDIVPCKIIELSDPIVVLKSAEHSDKTTVESGKQKEKEREQPAPSSAGNQKSYSQKTSTEKTTAKTSAASRSSGTAKVPKAENGFVKGIKAVGRFIINHPVESIEIAGVAIGGTIEVISAIAGSRNKGGGSSTHSPGGGGTASTPKTDIATKVADIVEKATRAENDVSGHKQRYHTKDGVIWKDKAPYHRGGKDS